MSKIQQKQRKVLKSRLFVLVCIRAPPPGGGVLPEKLGGGMRPASQNPYPIYDQNMRFSLPYLWPHF